MKDFSLQILRSNEECSMLLARRSRSSNSGIFRICTTFEKDLVSLRFYCLQRFLDHPYLTFSDDILFRILGLTVLQDFLLPTSYSLRFWYLVGIWKVKEGRPLDKFAPQKKKKKKKKKKTSAG